MPLQGEYEPSSSKWVRDQVEECESSGGTRGTTLRGVPVVVITSRDASSGKLRKNPVMRVEHDGVYAAVASKGGAPEHPAWYRNLVEHQLVELQDETSGFNCFIPLAFHPEHTVYAHLPVTTGMDDLQTHAQS